MLPSTNPNGGGYDNNGYRPSTRQSNRSQQDLHQMQPPPQPQLQADSVADMKRELKQRLEVETTSSSPDETNTTTSETGSEPNAAAASAAAGGEYQTMERSPLYESSTFRPAEGRRALPTTPPAPAPAADQTIPSVPGYAKPYARPFQPPPDPPASKPPRSFNYAPEPAGAGAGRDDHRPLLLETSLDDDTLTRRQKQPVRSRSVGQILETNLDDDVDQGQGGEADGGGGTGGDDAASHSRSLGGDKFPRLSATQPNSLLESDL